MPYFAETDPGLTGAARAALEEVEPVGPERARETTFTFRESLWWTRMTLDPHANTIEKWDIFLADDPQVPLKST